jgi:hypothetical protein
MRTPRSPRLHAFAGTARVVTAVVTMLQLLLVAAAPLAERQESAVAAIHVEQAGTSTHHAHGELCAVCAASHLVAPPARAGSTPVATSATTSAVGDSRAPSTAADRLDTQPRAPPA